MTQTTSVPFSALVAVEAIQARAASKDGLAELADSIAVKGLIQPLAVRPSADRPDRFEVIDGRRRYGALQRLVKDRRAGWGKSTPVPVLVRNEDDREALETSLIANVVRLPMHPVDQHDVFARLVAQGTDKAEIAARFGLAPRTVEQQLALARLAPAVRDAWRKGKLTAEAAQAFTLAPSHEAQAAALARLLKSYRDGPSGHVVRQELSAGRTRAQDVPAAVLERYTVAGGVLTDDLFSEDRYVEDALLLRTAEREWNAARTAPVRDLLAGQGWAWVASADEVPHGWRWQWRTMHPRHSFAMTEEQENRHNDLIDDFDNCEDESKADALALAADLYAIECEAASYTAEERALSGVVIEMHGDMEIRCAFGLIRPEQETAVDDMDEAAADNDDDGDPGELPSASALVGQPPDDEEAGATISFALRQTLGEAQTRAVAAIVTHDAELALRLAVAALCTTSTASPVKLSIDHTAHDRPATGDDFAAKLAAVQALSYGEVVQKFASLIARGLQLSPVNKWDAGTVAKLAAALLPILDPAQYATWIGEAFLAEDYFKRAPKAVAVAAIGEMQKMGCAVDLAPADELATLRKDVLAERAAMFSRRHGWLPPELRHPAYCLENPAQRSQEAA